MTYRLTVVLATAVQQLDARSESAPTTILAEVLSADGQGLIASSESAPYVFPGLDEGDYVFRASGLDSKGAVMGVPYETRFTASDATAEPGEPGADDTIDVELPAGATLTLTRE